MFVFRVCLSIIYIYIHTYSLFSRTNTVHHSPACLRWGSFHTWFDFTNRQGVAVKLDNVTNQIVLVNDIEVFWVGGKAIADVFPVLFWFEVV